MNPNSTLLSLEIPRTNDKKELAAEQMFASLHGILKPRLKRLTEHDHISFEIAAIGQRIRFYVWAPNHLQSFVEGQIYAQYPTAQITVLDEDYASRKMEQKVIYSTELTLTDHQTIPIKTFPSFEVDPLAAITATLSKLDKPNEEMWVQFIARPISDEWHRTSAKMAARIKAGRGGFSNAGLAGANYMAQALGALFKPPEPGKDAIHEVSERDKTRITAIEEKSRKLGYQVKVRIIYSGNDRETAQSRMQAMVGTFKQFNTTNLNGFESKYPSFLSAKLVEYQARSFIDKGYILNIEELASLFHLPHTTVETPNIVWSTTKTAEPPSTLPTFGSYPEEEMSLFGSTNFRGSNSMFGILRGDRGRHMYILGQTGTGKSGLLELLTLSDIFYDQGFAVIDPHGDYAINILQFIPERRVGDVIYFNPADSEFPIGFNPLEMNDSISKGQVSSELVGVLKRMFDSWGPRLEYILRFTILALLDYPNSTMLDITRMLTEKRFRNDVISYIDDPVVKNFWVTEFASWNEKFANEAVAPVLNKVGAFTANPLVRNIIGQPKGSFNIRKIMDEGKIFVVNLSKGRIGEDNAAILGAMLVTKIQLAAMSRADIPKLEDRRPFYLYVDEFQNFATDSFAVILSEARKYGLNLTIANQYISQMEDTVRSAVFGNVGSMITFRVSPDDSPFLIKYFEPQFEAADLSNFHNRLFVASMSVNGEKTAAFSGKSLNIPAVQHDLSPKIIQLSRDTYAADKKTVEGAIRLATEPIKPPASTNGNTNGRVDYANSGQRSKPSIARSAVAAVLQTTNNPNPTDKYSAKSNQPESASAKRRKRRKRAAEAQQAENKPAVDSPQEMQMPSERVVSPKQSEPKAEQVPINPVAKPKHRGIDETIVRLR